MASIVLSIDAKGTKRQAASSQPELSSPPMSVSGIAFLRRKVKGKIMDQYFSRNSDGEIISGFSIFTSSKSSSPVTNRSTSSIMAEYKTG